MMKVENYDMRKKEYEERKLAQQNADSTIEKGLLLAEGGRENGAISSDVQQQYAEEDWGEIDWDQQQPQQYQEQQESIYQEANGYGENNNNPEYYVGEDGQYYTNDGVPYQEAEGGGEQQYTEDGGAYQYQDENYTAEAQQDGYQENYDYSTSTAAGGGEGQEAWAAEEGYAAVEDGYQAGYEEGIDPNQQGQQQQEGEGMVYAEEGTSWEGYQQGVYDEGGGAGGEEVPQEYQQGYETQDTQPQEGGEAYHQDGYYYDTTTGEGTYEQQQAQEYQEAVDMQGVYDEAGWDLQLQQEPEIQQPPTTKQPEKATSALLRPKKRVFLEDNSDDDFEDPQPTPSRKRKADVLSTKEAQPATTTTTTKPATTTTTTTKTPAKKPLALQAYKPANNHNRTGYDDNATTTTTTTDPGNSSSPTKNVPVKRATLHMFRYEKKHKTGY